MLRVLNKLPDTAILRNRGCGIGFVQRRGKIPFDQVPPDSWFLKEKLCDKIAIIKAGRLIRSGTMEDVRGDDSLEDVFLELEEE